MKEATLNRLKAERCTPAQLIGEMDRITRALTREDTTAKQAKRYLERRAIYEAELTARCPKGGAR